MVVRLKKKDHGIYKYCQFTIRSFLLLTFSLSVLCAWLAPNNGITQHLAGSLCVTGFILIGVGGQKRKRGFGVLRGSAYSAAIGGLIGGFVWVTFTTVVLLATEYTIGDLIAGLPHRLFCWISGGGIFGITAGCVVDSRRFKRPAQDESVSQFVDESVRCPQNGPTQKRRQKLWSAVGSCDWMRERWKESPALAVSLAGHVLLLSSLGALALDQGFRPTSGPRGAVTTIEVMLPDEAVEGNETTPFTNGQVAHRAVGPVIKNEDQRLESLKVDPVSEENSQLTPTSSNESNTATLPQGERNSANKSATDRHSIENIGPYLFGTGGQAKSMIEFQVPYEPTDVAFSPDGLSLAIGGYTEVPVRPNPGYVTLRSLSDGTIRNLPEFQYSVRKVLFSPDGSEIVATTKQSRFDRAKKDLGGVWNAMSGRPIRAIIPPSDCSTNIGMTAAYSPDGKQLALGYGNSLRLQNASTGETLKSTKVSDTSGGLTAIYTIDFSPDGSMLVVGHSEGVSLVDVPSWRVKRSFPGGLIARISPNGKTILTTQSDQYKNFGLELWDAESGNLQKTFAAHTNCIYDCVFSPDGQYVASCGKDKTIRIWDVGSGALLHTSTEHKGAVSGVAFTADGNILASAGYDGVRVWNLRKILNQTPLASK